MLEYGLVLISGKLVLQKIITLFLKTKKYLNKQYLKNENIVSAEVQTSDNPFKQARALYRALKTENILQKKPNETA